MTTLVETVARAICLAELPTDDKWEWCVPAAIAALKAMKVPSMRMLQAADGWTDLVGPYPEANTAEERLKEFRCAWQAMIDAALQEHSNLTRQSS